MTMDANSITNTLLKEIPKRWNILCWRNNTGAGYGLSVVKAAVRMMKNGNIGGAIAMLTRPIKWGLVGSSDIICVLPPNGRFLGIEIKDPETRDDQSPVQKAFESRVRGLGGGYILAESVQQALADIAKELP